MPGPGSSAGGGLRGNGAGGDRHGRPLATLCWLDEPGAALGGKGIYGREAVADGANRVRHEHFAVVRKPIDGEVPSHGCNIVAPTEKNQ